MDLDYHIEKVGVYTTYAFISTSLYYLLILVGDIVNYCQSVLLLPLNLVRFGWKVILD